MDTCYVESIENSLGNIAPDLILKNGEIVDVCSGLIKKGDITIKDHRIIGIYDDYSNNINNNTKVIDVTGKYLVPGFIEPHIHVESSMLSMTNFSETVIPHGTTTIINDPHEIANVLGKNGIRHMMNEAEDTHLRTYFTVPSCVPALGGDFETNGAKIGLRETKSLMENRRIIGLGEVMNYYGVINANADVLSKIDIAYKSRGLKKTTIIIDGHSPFLTGKDLSAYINGGIMADHECSTGVEMEEKLSKGMYIMIRNGSSAKNMETLLKYIIENNIDTRRTMFCVDDKNPYELLKLGHIDYTLKKAMEIVKNLNSKLTVVDIIRMATLNVAEFFGFRYLGKLIIQARADIVVLDDLENFNVKMTIINGKIRALDGKNIDKLEKFPYHDHMLNTVNITKVFTRNDFKIKSKKTNNVRVIQINPGELFTDELILNLESTKDELVQDIKNDILKISIVHRHTGKSNYSLGFVKGFGIKKGAVATTIGHDSHNLIVIGAKDSDMAFAVEKLKEMQGGIVVVENCEVLASLELRIGGLQSLKKPDVVVKEKIKIYNEYKKLGGNLKDPIISMSFLQLPVIPTLKMTDKSLIKITNKGINKVDLFVGN